MKLRKLALFLPVITLFVACTKQVPNETKSLNKVDEKIKVVQVEKKPVATVEKYKLSKNENEFIKVLENDSYASLCSLQNKYLKTINMEDSLEKSTLLKSLFVEYTENLANSCIDQISFNQFLKDTTYKKRKQYYETYNTQIDKDKLLEKFNDNTISIKSILDEYSPKHPNFFKFIKKLDTKKLSSNEYNKLRLNIERLKLIKDYDSKNFIQLNIPSYNFKLYEDGIEERSFGTVVGEKDSQTPILSSKLSYFIINPPWNIPDSIAKSTIIPRALKDKNYLKRKNIVIRKNYKLDSKKIRFSSVNWKKYLKKDVKYIPYKFIQLPSSTNGMGKVKYMFSNDYAVYMHDTIGTWRFKVNKENIRSASHGCVRLEHPISLMKHLTTYYTPKSYKTIRKTYLKGDMDTVSLSKKIPLHIMYLTADIDKKGKLKFYKDIYEYDKIQNLNFIPYDSAVEIASLK